MPTAASSTEPGVDGQRVGRDSRLRRTWTGQVRAYRDLGHLVRFRAGTVQRRRSALVASTFVSLTLGAAIVPAFTPGAGDGDGRAWELLLLMPSALAGFQLLALVSAIASGGGRELLPRDQAVAFPISATTDHLGALILAPLNIAWLLQSWTLLGVMAYAVGPGPLVPAQLGVVAWILLATAVGQVVAWAVEGVRRLPGGVAAVRTVAGGVLAAAAFLQVTGRVGDVLDQLPTTWFVARIVGGWSPAWALALTVEVLAFVTAVAVGAVPAHLAARLAAREELRAESDRQRPRRTSRWVLGTLVRLDRASVWRAVPMRRGLAVLAIGPGLVALAGGLPWDQLMILPGLVASGGALLFGVNAWCLEGRGVLWRESLPVSPGLGFVARAWVLTEFLLVASGVTLALAALRAGAPTASQVAALLCAWLVVVLQVVSASLRWSQRSPYSVDLRSARATPAPPVAMVGYSTKLAIGTTLTGLVFSGLAAAPIWQLSLLVAVPFCAWSVLRLLQARDGWVRPADRARVVMTVAG